MKEQLKKMKEELKELAQQIKTLKPEYRQSQRACSKADPKDPKLGEIWRNSYLKQMNLQEARSVFRLKHIAYCLLRGRTIDQIENKNREGNAPNMKWVNHYIKEAQDAQALCDSAKQSE